MILERKRIPAIAQHSTEEKLTLVAELWNDVAANPENIPVSAETLAELDRRLDQYHRHPDQITTWEDVKKRILASR